MKLKSLLFLSSILFSTMLFAQDLSIKVPKSAMVVSTINTPNIFSKISEDKINSYPFIKKWLQELYIVSADTVIFKDSLSDDWNEEIVYEYAADSLININNLGLDFSRKAYLFFEMTDSINYTAALIPLNNSAKFQEILNTTKHPALNEGDYWVVNHKNYTIAWNTNFALFIKGKASYKYFTETDEIYARYDLKTKRDTTKEYDYRFDYKVRNEIGAIWTKTKLQHMFNMTSNQSIVTNKKFSSSINKKSDASVWMAFTEKEYMKHFASIYYGSLFNMADNEGGDDFFGYKNFKGDLYFNENNIKFDYSVKMNSKMYKSYKKVSKAKINPDFLNQVSENDLGYVSYAANTQALLEEMPNIIKSYTGILGHLGYLANNSMDLFSLVIDEKAIGKLIPGDMLITVSDLVEKEVFYKSYTYDSAFNKTTVIKSKMDRVPDVLGMISTNDSKNFLKILELIQISGKVEETEDGYTVIVPKDETTAEIYYVLKNNIFYITNSKTKILNIVYGVSAPNLVSKQKRKQLLNSNAFMYVNGKNILSKIEEPKKENNKQALLYAGQNTLDSYIIQNKPKNKSTSATWLTNTPSSYKNSLTYLFEFINSMNVIYENE